MLSFNHSQVVQEPTRIISSNRATLIDLALVSNLNYFEECSVIPPLANSDHNGISLAIKQKKPPKSSARRLIWKYSQADFAKASDLLDETDWDSLFSGKSVDEACLIWQEHSYPSWSNVFLEESYQTKGMFLGHHGMLDASS